ncbi:HVA22-like protein j isoform C [Glycine soja]|uniref:HVA22-like protein n=1 Tax=Glycine soja TaxID=3848 RepID=A0A445LEI2_GLYSO|nr:HVA22-like protein j isoform C [Glycine soja]
MLSFAKFIGGRNIIERYVVKIYVKLLYIIVERASYSCICASSICRVIVALFTVLENFTDAVIGWWFPLYGELKLALFIYLWYPKTKGTGYVYNTVLRPYVSSHENDIEKKFREWRARAWDLAIFYWKNCTELGQATTFQILDYLAAQSKKFSSKSYSEVNFPFP